jgi:Transposase
MKKSRFTTEQIIGFIKQADAGMAVAELGRQHGFSPASFNAWRAKKNQGQCGLSGLRCASSDFFGLPILPGPAGRPRCASIAARNPFDP